jgi:hypothetical protein
LVCLVVVTVVLVVRQDRSRLDARTDPRLATGAAE